VTRTGVLSAVAAAAALVAPSAASAELTAATGPSEAGAPEVYTEVSRKELIFDRGHSSQLTFRVRDNGPVDVRIRLIDTKLDRVVKSWEDTVRDADVRTVGWRGVSEGDLGAERRYAFRVKATDDGGATTESADAGDIRRDSFKFWHHRFPVRGAHQYWDGFGAGRGHQGQDLGANCGTRIDAARGGKVQYAGYHDAAGNYVVIDGKKTSRDYAYMHLENLSSVSDGERVHAAEKIGTVGETGNASGCHLHFEMWSGPGWYEGGAAMDPTSALKTWDRYS
jgi:murein DD-endopeptidase MepM/ murein hydrolase activator NlpD